MLPDIDIGGSWMDWILTDVSPSPTLFVQSFSAELSKGFSAAFIGMIGQVYLLCDGFDMSIQIKVFITFLVLLKF